MLSERLFSFSVDEFRVVVSCTMWYTVDLARTLSFVSEALVEVIVDFAVPHTKRIPKTLVPQCLRHGQLHLERYARKAQVSWLSRSSYVWAARGAVPSPLFFPSYAKLLL